MPTKAANMSKKRDAADEVPSRPKRARTAAPSDAEPTATTAKTATKKPLVKEPIQKKSAAKKAAAPKASKPAKEEKPGKKPVLTNGEPASKKRSSPDLAESAAKRVKVNGDAPKKRIAKPKAPAKVAAKSPVEITKKLPAINSAPTQRLMIFACGEGSAGELGMGPKKSVDVKRPRLNVLLDAKTVGVVQIATGGMHCVALTHDNKILTWGVNDQCALGRDTDWDGGLRDMDAKSDCSDDSDDSDTGLNPKESTPDSIADDAFPAGTRFVQVAAGDSCSFALTDTGLVYGWGTFRDGNGIFGFTLDSKKEIVLVQRTPALILNLKNVVSISAGGDFALALDKNGDVYGWGNGQQDQLGRRLLERRRKEALLPTRIALPRKTVASVFAATNHAFAIDKAGEVWAWGLNNFAQTGISFHAGDDGGTVTAPTKVAAFSGKDVKMLAGGSHHSLAVTGSGACMAWGRMDGDQIGIDFAQLPVTDDTKVVSDERDRPRILLEPTAVPGIVCQYVAAASDTNLAITKDGKAYSWGFNANYQCGQGHEEDVKVATLIDNTAVRDKKLVWAGAGGQYSMFAAHATQE